jgi:EAL domain-containing protein (putative c-di-GMP-specific phosphodiesterase class I)
MPAIGSSTDSQPVKSNPVSQNLGARHLRRVESMLTRGSYMIFAQAGGWAIFAALYAQWLVASMSAAGVLSACATLYLLKQGKIAQASAVLLTSLLIITSLICLCLDVPSPAVPRSTHHFMLALGASAYLLLRGSPDWIRQGVTWTFFLAFCLFASTNWSWESSYALSDEVRTVGIWVNNGMSIVTLYMVLHVMQADMLSRNQLESELRHTILEGRLLLHYQPQVDQDGEVFGAEALVRWPHPRKGLIPPNDFIPLAERTGLILPLGEWVLKQACAQLAMWAQHPSTSSLTMSVNVSAIQFHQPDFVAQVLGIVERSGVAPDRLKLELTESMLVSDIDDIITKMTALKSHGVGFSMDDFGTGYSSLAYLQRMPLDQLKIDQAFVRDLLTNPNAAAIASTLVKLGQDLGLKVIAEGVETQEQREFLSSIGCHAFQGYLYSKPLPVAEFDTFAHNASKGPDQAPLPCKAVLSPPQRAAFVGKTSTAPV